MFLLELSSPSDFRDSVLIVYRMLRRLFSGSIINFSSRNLVEIHSAPVRQFVPPAQNGGSLLWLIRSSMVVSANFRMEVRRALDDLSLGIMLIKREYQPKLLRRKRKHGFLKRISNPGGRKILERRRAKKRWCL